MTKLIFTTLIALSSTSLFAAEVKCRLEHHRESATPNTAALVCGEFNFEPAEHSPLKKVFEKCQNVAVEFGSNPSATGVEYSLELSQPLTEKSSAGLSERTALVAKTFPTEFRLERSIPFRGKKRVLYDDYVLECRQL